MKATSKAVKASRAKHGVKSTSFAFTEGEKAEIDALAERLGASRKDAIVKAVRAYGRSDLSADELVALVRARMR